MPRDPDSDVLTDFLDAVVQPLCVEFASRIGADEPRRFEDEQRVGTTVTLPRGFRSDVEQHFTVSMEPFDEETFVVKASRPDQVEELRQLTIVRYDDVQDAADYDESAIQVQSKLDTAFEQLRQRVTTERTS